MAGLFALRELKTNRAKFDPFALPETDDEDDLDDVEEPEDDGKIVTAPAMKTKARFEVNAAEAEFWKRSQGYRVDWSGPILGFGL